MDKRLISIQDKIILVGNQYRFTKNFALLDMTKIRLGFQNCCNLGMVEICKIVDKKDWQEL